MSVAGASAGSGEEKSRQIDRLVSSAILQGSESLCKLLRYLADHSLRNPGVPVKEYQIALEVFGRPANFDPRLDSTVRVQTGRLRTKLANYYHGPGANDAIVVEIPRGSYLLSFTPRSPEKAEPTVAAVIEAAPQPAAEAVSPAGSPRGWMIAFAMMTAVALALLAFILVGPTRTVAPVSRNESIQALRHFWAPFIQGSAPAWAVFSDAGFSSRPEQPMRYDDPARDEGQPDPGHFTGEGEVLAVHELDRVFAALDHDLRVKRGRLLSLDDVKNYDLVFIGSPRDNVHLRDLPSTSEFQFRPAPDGARNNGVMIANAHPRAGEQSSYMSSGFPLTDDYAIIALAPGLNPAHHALILAG